MTRPRLRYAAFLFVVALVARPIVTIAAPLDATVFVRLIGQVKVLRGEDERAWREQLLNLREVEVGSGSGFIISPDGWIVTNHHVISGEKFTLLVRGEKLEVSIDVSRIEVVLAPDGAGQPGRRFEASVYAADPELDLAVLRINGTNLPYVSLGDSDVVEPADAATAIGYPFGGLLDLENPKADANPNPSVSTGAISALRHDSLGGRRLLQVSTVLNPGNSGGPVVDAEGYAIGVAQSRLTNAAAIGFAVPINRVKGLLQKYGLDSSLPVELLSVGGSLANTAKGVSVRVPVGFEDRSAGRLRVDAMADGANSPASGRNTADSTSNSLALRIDRVATGQSVEQLEGDLVTGGMFERFHAVGTVRRSTAQATNGRRAVAGHASGTDPSTGDRSKLVYVILDLGKEKIVARYAGPADTIAANRSLLHASLADLEAAPLLTAEVTRALQPHWDAGSQPNEFSLPIVGGWITEPGLPWQCAAGLHEPSGGLATSPLGDFTVVLRAAWFGQPAKDPKAAARQCSAQPGTHGEASYAARAAVLGIEYHIEGVFVQRSDGHLWQLEVITPVAKSRFVVRLFGDWIKAAGY